MTHEQVDNALADAVWWFKGHAAALPPGERGELINLSRKLTNVRNWLCSLAEGDARMIGTDENTIAFAIREVEFEHALDALRHPSTEAERQTAANMLSAAYETVKRERSAAAAAKSKDVPF